MTDDRSLVERTEEYEAPRAQDLDTEHCPAVTCAATQQSPAPDD
jgi:hypothetical protein